MIKSSKEECAIAYSRGYEIATAAIRKFGYNFAETALSLNHPKPLKSRHKSQADRWRVKGSFDALKAAKYKPK